MQSLNLWRWGIVSSIRDNKCASGLRTLCEYALHIERQTKYLHDYNKIPADQNKKLVGVLESFR